LKFSVFEALPGCVPAQLYTDRSGLEMFFEENPWLLIPVIILTVEAWNITKVAVRAAISSRRSSQDGLS
jgi:hypothetical protein